MASSSATPPPPWVELPAEISAAILQKLGAIEMLKTAQRVCTTWRNICKDPATWRVIHMLRDLQELDYHSEEMCRHAVNHSQGQLLDVSIQYFADNDLLAYIAQRSSQLRRLRIVCGYYVTGEGLSQAVNKFPLLEKLHLYHTSIDVEAITVIGCSCPLLKSFKLNHHGYKFRFPHTECDEEALAVAASMPELHHLQLFGNTLTNEGLTAILNGCSKLESLDLRHCCNVNFGGNLGTRCSQQIKDLRLPDDSTEDYLFNYEICHCESSDEGEYDEPWYVYASDMEDWTMISQ